MSNPSGQQGLSTPFRLPLRACDEYSDDIKDSGGDLVLQTYGKLDDPTTQAKRNYTVRAVNSFDDMLAALKDAEPLLMKLCTVVMNEKVAEYLPFGLLDEVKNWIAHSGAQKAIAKAERGQ